MPRLPFTKPTRKYQRRKAIKTIQTFDEALEKELIRRARRDPDWAFDAAKRRFNISGPEDEDPLDKLRRVTLAEALAEDPEFAEQVKQQYLQEHGGTLDDNDLEKRISEAASEELERNPELLAKAVRRRIDTVLNHSSDGGGISELLAQLRGLRELEEEVGGDKKIGGFLDASLLTEMVKALPLLLGKSVQGPPTEIYVVRMPNGEEARLTPTQFAEYERRKALSPGKQVSEAEEAGESEEDVSTPPPTGSVSLKLTDWEPYLDREPSEFVSALEEQIEQGDSNAVVAKQLLTQRTAEEILTMLHLYRDNTEVGPIIQKIEERQEWLKEVVCLFQKGQKEGV